MVFVVAVAVVTIAHVHVATTRERRAVLGAAARGPHPHGAALGKHHVLASTNEALSCAT